MKIPISEQENELFAKEMLGVSPLKKNERISIKVKETDLPGLLYRREKAAYGKDETDMPLSLVLRKKLNNEDWLSYKRNGIQTSVFKNLRVGKYPHETTLNLNKKLPEQARNDLIQCMEDCQEINIRSLLIYFAGGVNGNLLKSYLAQWLPEINTVQAFHTAQKHHGGSSALYVLLRKSEQKRTENRERHAARLGSTI